MARGPLNKDSHWSLFSSSRSITAFQSRALGVGLQCELWRPVLALTQHRGLFPRERERERHGVGGGGPIAGKPTDGFQRGGQQSEWSRGPQTLNTGGCHVLERP